MKPSLLFLISLLGLFINSACTTMNFERSAASGYNNYSDSHYREVSLKDLSGRHNDFSSRSLSPKESNEYQVQSSRKKLEETLVTPEERKQYVRYKPYLNESEKIEFLELPDIYARERWIQSRGLNFSSDRHSRNIASLIENNDISLGMEKEAVKDSWGDPDYVEVSGNPKFENERWRFSIPIQTPEGYQIEERFVYFENGRVVGWKTR